MRRAEPDEVKSSAWRGCRNSAVAALPDTPALKI
jgi:hypothetical protein